MITDGGFHKSIKIQEYPYGFHSHTLGFHKNLLIAKYLSLLRISSLRNSELEYYIYNPN